MGSFHPLAIDVHMVLFAMRAATAEAVYTVMNCLDTTILRAGALGSLGTGVALSLLTPYGLFRHRWIIHKEGVTAAVIAFDTVGVHSLHQRVGHLLATPGSLDDQAYLDASRLLLSAVAIQVVSLTSALVVSSIKPWGRRLGRCRFRRLLSGLQTSDLRRDKLSRRQLSHCLVHFLRRIAVRVLPGVGGSVRSRRDLVGG